MIHYGVSGFNILEHWECCYTLNSYHVPPSVVREHFEFITRFKTLADFDIATTGIDRCISGHLSARDRLLAEGLLSFNELDQIYQAVGRTRPFTNENKEVVVISRNRFAPAMVVVDTVGQLRDVLELPMWDENRIDSNVRKVTQVVSQGLSEAEALAVLDMPRSTYYYYKKMVKNA